MTALLVENPISVSREDAPDLYDKSVDRIMGDSRTWGKPSPILTGIVAPNLRNLTAHAECLPSLASFLSRVSDTLEFIDVSGLRNASPLDSAAARALRSATQLRRLRLAHCELTRGFLRKLRAAAGDIWPRLQDFTLNSVRYDDERLLRFFEKRYPSHDAVPVEIPVPVVVVRFVGAEMRDSPTAIAVSSLLDDERRRRSLPDVARPVRVNIDSLG